MLVLSRKEGQRVEIPGLDISIKVLRCKGSSVAIGFEAPPEIKIIRDELDPGVSVKDVKSLREFLDKRVSSYPSEERHDIRDQFNTVTMALQMLLDDIDSGELQDIDAVFDSICGRLSALRSTPNDKDAFVLVVEDQENERELLAGILRMNGYLVATASDGVEALEYLEKHGAPAFILVDMEMPRCDGEELVRKIRESVELAGVRVYVISGSDENEYDVVSGSVSKWYTKPLEPSTLISEMSMPSPK